MFKEGNQQRGFTLVESLVTLSIIAMIIAISTFSVSCYTNNSYLADMKISSISIQSSIKSYYNSNDQMPVTGTPITELSADVKDLARNKMTSDDSNRDLVSEMLSKGVLFRIDTSKIRFTNNISAEDVNKFFVVYVSDDQLKKDPSLLDLSRYNSTLIMGEVLTSCIEDSFSVALGKDTYRKTSESLKYNVDTEYIDCPNPDLCKKIENN